MPLEDQQLPASGAGAASQESVALLAQCFHALGDNIERVVKGKRETVELALVCLFSEGHLLIEDVPGTGKTTLARCLAASLDADWHRVQFTPDLLPSDITGVTVYRQNTGAFEFLPGPVFANIVLGDEINRASPKTQSALLEVMEERQVTADGSTHAVPRPFMVIATQNPVDMGGTYPLPEAQLDRFLMQVTLGYPDHASEVAVLSGAADQSGVEQLPTIATDRHIAEFVRLARRIQVAPRLYDYLVRVVAATRELPEVRLGASPRGSVALLRAVRVRAASQGRTYALPEDVKALARPVLAHRLILTPEAELSGRSGADVIAEALATVPVPQTGAAG
ncbi:AAA family ATPase [Streptomyces qinglanensis]|uniref:MoxR-like ATPase n=1 Tax=Streptomyces qinglanensis TaxID=943816 RepID=A0A1H9SFC1_9ACTN|nr:MoxR family ATPase [Streptomyces qinglanensis]SER83667.1 MoxR-like ATPase [Streptomyces qinglanensis]